MTVMSGQYVMCHNPNSIESNSLTKSYYYKQCLGYRFWFSAPQGTICSFRCQVAVLYVLRPVFFLIALDLDTISALLLNQKCCLQVMKFCIFIVRNYSKTWMLMRQSSDILRRPQQFEKSPTHFVAFSQYLNFNESKFLPV